MIYETNHRHKKGSDLWHLVSNRKHLNMKIIRWTDMNFTHNHEGFFLKSGILGLPWWRSGYESPCQCRGLGFDPWSGKIPLAPEQLSPCATTTAPVLLSPHATTTEAHAP